MRLFTFSFFATLAAAITAAHADNDATTGQNAVTRALKEPLSGIASAVPNPKTVPCYDVVDCREKGRDLEAVWQMNTQTSAAAAPQSGNCPMRDTSSKYHYLHNAC